MLLRGLETGAGRYILAVGGMMSVPGLIFYRPNGKEADAAAAHTKLCCSSDLLTLHATFAAWEDEVDVANTSSGTDHGRSGGKASTVPKSRWGQEAPSFHILLQLMTSLVRSSALEQ